MTDPDRAGVKLFVWSKEPATLELYDPEMVLLERSAVSPLSGSAVFELARGHYYLRVRGIDGRSARVPVDMTEGNRRLDTAEMWLDEKAFRSGRRPEFRSERKTLGGLGRLLGGVLGGGPGGRSLQITPLWLPAADIRPDDPRVALPNGSVGYGGLDSDWADLCFEQKHGLIFARIAPSRSREPDDAETVTLSVPALDGRLDLRTDAFAQPCPVDYRPNQPSIAALFAILQAEAPEAPVAALGERTLVGLSGLDTDHSVYELLDDLAWQLVRDKFRLKSPVLAAAGALYLLKINHLNHLHRVRDWPRNVADYFPWMPDGAIVEGWRRLVTKGESGNPEYPAWRREKPPPPRSGWPEPNRARPDAPLTDAALRFSDAVDCGPPILSMALERLRDGLNFCARRKLEHDGFPGLAERVERAAQTARTWSALSCGTGAVTAYAAPLAQLVPSRRGSVLGEPFTLDPTNAGY